MFFSLKTEGGKDPVAEIGLRPTSTRISGCHVWQRDRSSFVLSLRRLEIFGSGFALPQGGSQRAVEIIDVADAPRSDVEIGPGQTS